MLKAYDTLGIEVTRRCNMHCAHCLRGDAEQKDIEYRYIDALLTDIKYISSLLITGGEPSLNPKAIQYIADVIRSRDICLGGVALITNGKTVPDGFITACASLFSLATEDECSYLAVSRDIFHEEPPRENLQKLSIFKAFQPDGHRNDWDRMYLKDLGRARDLVGYQKAEVTKPDELWYEYDAKAGVILFSDTVITMTVNGDILSDCDYDFKDTMNWRIGHVTDPYWAERAIGIVGEKERRDTRCA